MTMSEVRPDEAQGAVATGSGIDRAENDAAIAKVLRTVEDGPEHSGASRGVPRVDPMTGEVSGAGSGTGGGNPGEDHDDDHTAGSNSLR